MRWRWLAFWNPCCGEQRQQATRGTCGCASLPARGRLRHDVPQCTLHAVCVHSWPPRLYSCHHPPTRPPTTRPALLTCPFTHRLYPTPTAIAQVPCVHGPPREPVHYALHALVLPVR